MSGRNGQALRTAVVGTTAGLWVPKAKKLRGVIYARRDWRRDVKRYSSLIQRLTHGHKTRRRSEMAALSWSEVVPA
jgi:hypothetical protein